MTTTAVLQLTDLDAIYADAAAASAEDYRHKDAAYARLAARVRNLGLDAVDYEAAIVRLCELLRY